MNTLGNCYKVFINGRFVAVFATEDAAEMYCNLMKQIFYSAQETHTEKAFIEGIGF